MTEKGRRRGNLVGEKGRHRGNLRGAKGMADVAEESVMPCKENNVYLCWPACCAHSATPGRSPPAFHAAHVLRPCVRGLVKVGRYPGAEAHCDRSDRGASVKKGVFFLKGKAGPPKVVPFPIPVLWFYATKGQGGAATGFTPKGRAHSTRPPGDLVHRSPIQVW